MSDPVRGEVWWVDMGLAGKVRPAMVVSAPIKDADYALVTVVPHTTSARGSQYELDMPLAGLKPGVFNIQGLAAMPLGKFVRRITMASAAQMALMDGAIRHWLCLAS
jgi:mRNA interferase MazF